MKLDLMEAAHSGVDRCQLALLHDLGFRPSGCYETQRQNWRLPETLTHVLAETKQAGGS